MTTTENRGVAVPEVAAATHLAAMAGAVLDVLADALEAPECLPGALRKAQEILGAATDHIDTDLEDGGPYNGTRLCDELMSAIGGPLSAYAVSYNEIRGRFDDLDEMELGGCVNAYNHALHARRSGETSVDIDPGGFEPLVDAEDYRPEGGGW